MTHFCFTGPRQITYGQGCKIERALEKLKGESWHVGDAFGVDLVVADYLLCRGERLEKYHAEGRQPWQLAARSRRMVDGCWERGNAKLIAFPNKPCPDGVKPQKTFRGRGSGTWGTIAYAKYLGLEVELVWLTPGLEPDWMKQEQLVLI